MSGGEVPRQLAALGEELGAGGQDRGDGVALFEKDLAAGLHLETGHPGLDGPDRIERLLLEERELVRVGGRQHLDVAAELRDAEALRSKPGAAGDVLGVPELRGGDLLALEVRGRLQPAFGVHHERRAAERGPGDDAHLFPPRSDVGVQRRIGPDVREIERLREERLHGARTGVVDEPLDLDAGAEALLEPSFPGAAEGVGDQRLRVCDVGEVADAQDDLLPDGGRAALGAAAGRRRRDYRRGEAENDESGVHRVNLSWSASAFAAASPPPSTERRWASPHRGAACVASRSPRRRG